MRTSVQHGRLRAPALAAAAVVLGDLATKRLAATRLDEPISLVAGLRLRLGYNSGIAFGALTSLPAGVLVVGVTCVVVGLIVAVARGALPIPGAAAGVLVGGAVANLFDRIVDGQVTDFIDPPRWPAFNLADVAITCAVIAMLWQVARDERRRTSPAGAG